MNVVVKPPTAEPGRLDDVLLRFKTTRTGLTQVEAESRLATYGPNEATAVPRASPLVQFILAFANPLVVILLLSSIVSGFLGEG